MPCEHACSLPGFIHHDLQRLSNGNSIFIVHEEVPEEYKKAIRDHINKISATFLKYHLLGMFSPISVEFYFSNDGIKFRKRGKIENDPPTSFDETVSIEKFEKNFRKESARYVKVIAKNIGRRPEWHHEAGEKAWL